jgi:hypothetical protein
MGSGDRRRAARRAARRRRALDGGPGREVPASGPGGMQVVIQQPGDGSVPGGRVIGGRQGAGVLADQVVEPVPAAGGLGDQVLVVEGLQAPARGGHAGTIQRRGGIGVDVGTRVQAQAAEQPPLGGGQVPVGQAERGRHRQVLRGHQLQPVFGRGQLMRQVRGAPGRVVGQLPAGHPDRQRQVPAQRDQLAHRRIAGGHVGPAGQPGQQPGRLARGQGIEADHGGVFQRGQPPHGLDAKPNPVPPPKRCHVWRPPGPPATVEHKTGPLPRERRRPAGFCAMALTRLTSGR